MNPFFFILLFLGLTVYGRNDWVSEQALFEEVDGKSYVIRIDEALKKQDYQLTIDLCDELDEKSVKPANKATILTLKGDALLAQREDEEAFQTYQLAIEKYPAYINYGDLIKKQLEIANREYELIKGNESIFLDRSKAINYFKQIITNAPFADKAPFLLLRVGILQKEDDQPEEAAQSYRTLVKRYRTSTEAGYARLNLAQHYLNLLDKVDGNQQLIKEAKTQLILFTQQFTSHPMLPEARRRLKEIYNIEAERLYLLAVFYNRKETPYYRPVAAEKYFRELVINYGDSDFAKPAQQVLETMDSDYQINLVEQRDETRQQRKKDRMTLAPEATDKSRRRVLIKKGDSDQFLLPVEDLDLTPLENNKVKEKTGDDKK